MLVFRFHLRGGILRFYVNYVFIAQFMLKTYRQLNTEYIMIVHTCGADCVNYSSDILLGINEFKWGVIHLDR